MFDLISRGQLASNLDMLREHLIFAHACKKAQTNKYSAYAI